MTTDPIAASVASSVELLRVSFADSVLSVIALVPQFLLATALVGFGIAASFFVAAVTRYVVAGLGLDTLSDRTGFTKALSFFSDKLTLSHALGFVFEVAFASAFVLAALRVVGFDSAITFVSAVLAYTPRIVVTLIALLAGFSGAEGAVWLVKRSVTFFKIPVGSPATLALLVRFGLIGLGLFAALRALGVPDSFMQILFAAALLAAAIAFGFGGKEHAAAFLAKQRKDI